MLLFVVRFRVSRVLFVVVCCPCCFRSFALRRSLFVDGCLLFVNCRSLFVVVCCLLVFVVSRLLLIRCCCLLFGVR